jgi:hypothetical protein
LGITVIHTLYLYYYRRIWYEYGTKKSVVAFSLFPEESLNQLKALQFRELQVIGLQYPTNQHRGRHFDGEPVIAEVVEQPIATKDGTLTLKRGIAIEGRFLAPLQQESPSYPVGSFFQATVKLAPPASALATLPDGQVLEIRKLLSYAHAGVRFESEPVSLTIEPSRDGLLVSLSGSPLGLLTPESAGIARSQYGSLFSRTKQLTVEATLTSASSNTAILRTDPSTFQSPWQMEARCLGGGREVGVERSTEIVREQLREQYIAYVGRAYELDPELAAGLALDLQVAQLAYADGRTFNEIASLLSTSDTLLKVRPAPGSPAWEFYEAHARKYVLEVLRESDASNGHGSPLSPTEPHLHDTYRSYAERVRRANPYVEGGVELDRQVAALARADGRSREEEEAILRASDVLLMR